MQTIVHGTISKNVFTINKIYQFKIFQKFYVFEHVLRIK